MEVERISYAPEALGVAFSAEANNHCDISLHLLHSFSSESTRIPSRRRKSTEGGFVAFFDVDLMNLQYAIDGISVTLECGLEPIVHTLFGSRDAPLYIRDDADYERRFKLRNKALGMVESRTGHYLADFLAAFQVQDNSKIERHFKCGASVIMAYKAVDLGNAELMKLARVAVNYNLQRVEQCGSHQSPRKDREHLLFSLLCARWHIDLFLAGAEELTDTLEKVYRWSGDLRNYFTPAYPINTSLLVYVLFLVSRSENKKARAVIAHMHKVYKKAVARSDVSRLAHFKELTKSNKCVAMAEETYRAFDADKSRSFAEQVMKESFRGFQHRELAIKRLDRMVSQK